MEIIKVNGMEFCASCYKQASKESTTEEGGFLAYDFLHYEYNHKEGN